MNTFLLKLLELSLQAGALTAAILLVRLAFRKLPAKYLCILWMIVAARLIIPFSIESSFAPMGWVDSLWPEKQQAQNMNSGTVYDDEISYISGSELLNTSEEGMMQPNVDAPDRSFWNGVSVYEPGTTKNQADTTVSEAESAFDWRDVLKLWTPVLFALWLLGMLMLLGYGALSCKKVNKLVKNAIHYEDNIWLCDGLESPFLFGWIHPKIYLPTNLEEKQLQYVIGHEKSHIARGDHLTKLIGYALLSVYWFNPLVWVAYVMFCKDVERACDERVIGGFSCEDRKGYAEVLLQCSADRKFAISIPLAFGEMDVKKRITGILKYKKPGKWLAALAVLLCVIAVAGCFFVQEEQAGEPSNTPTVIPTPTATPMPTVPPTPTPTLPPAIPTPAEYVWTQTITHIPADPDPERSDWNLLGKTTPESLVAVPLGQTVQVDLNGDGTKEAVTYGIKGYEGTVSYNDLQKDRPTWDAMDELYFLQINDTVYTMDEIGKAYHNEGPGFTTYYIFDIDVTDGYKEIGLFYSGVSADRSTGLYRYVDGGLHCVGTIQNAPLETDYSWVSSDYKDLSYEEMVEQVNREGFLITVPGDGTILCEELTVLVESTWLVMKYQLENAAAGKDAVLQRTWRPHYEFLYWDSDRRISVTAAREFKAYVNEAGSDEKVVIVPEGSEITFYWFMSTSETFGKGFVEFFYSVEERWDSKGVLYVGTQGIYLPMDSDTDRPVAYDARDLFENLSVLP